MNAPVQFHLTGQPQGKGRARAFVRGGHVAHYTPEKTRSYESMIRGAAMDAMGDREPMDMAVTVKLRAVFGIPASYSKAKRAAALSGALWPAKKPDLDNITKAWLDGMNGVVFRDDSQVVREEYSKVYGPVAMVVVSVSAA